MMPSEAGGSGNQPADLTASLIVGLRGGDPQAAAMLEDLYREALVRFCWGYLGRIEEAEDAAQDVCYKILSATTVPDSFRPWLYKTARNHCLNVLRQRGRQQDGAELPAASQIPELRSGHLTKLIRREQESRLGELVARLPEAQREVLRLRYVEGLSRGEIASVLETPESVVKSRLFEGLKRLRDHASFADER